jgi:hypothetical protein
MTIYTYHFAQNLCDALGIDFVENPDLSDQNMHKLPSNMEEIVIVGPYTKHIEKMSQDERNAMTAAANERKRGMKESDRSRGIKSVAQKERWQNMTDEQRKEIGKLSREGISEEGKIKAITALKTSYSPEREKGKKKTLVSCPHCDTIGGKPIMYRFHFEKCKNK